MDGWDRVIAAVVDRRAELGWTQQRLAAEAGVAMRTIQSLELGEARPQPRTRGRIERALGWQPGEFRRIEAADRPPIEPQDAWERHVLASTRLEDRDKRRMIERSRAIRDEMFPLPAAGGAAREDRGAAAS